ncbi:NACHT domain-containing protein [Micromonospora sp. NPDC050187]|uniref:NACHT domain-containing protein n=1 Tax=Micromonospora sp. NPDC050187 TaxID=3364277 RepID=UPI00379872F7
MTHRWSALVPLVLAIAIALVGNLATNTVSVPWPWWSWFIWSLVALLIVLSGAHGVLSSRPDAPVVGREALSSTAQPLTTTADQLAAVLVEQWAKEEHQQGLHDPFSLPVRWESVADHLMDHWANIRRSPAGSQVRPLRLAGSLNQIVPIYLRVPSGRLVVLGRSGAGKTTLARRFALNWLTRRTAGDPVAVVFSLASWNPRTTTLSDWLAGLLIRDHPSLAAPGPTSATLATALIDGGHLLPVLDGFDEIAEGLHDDALRAINTAGLPFLLTCRPEQYAAVVRQDVLSAAAVVELNDLTLSNIRDYLPRTTRRTIDVDGTRVPLWTPVLDRLRDNPRGPAEANLAAVLASPLMVGLARSVYSDAPGADPAELLDAAKFPDSAALEAHLLSAFIPIVYGDAPRDRHRGARRHSFRTGDAQRWLRYLAEHANQTGSQDLAWWRFGDALPRTTRILTGTVTLGMLALAMGGFVFLLSDNVLAVAILTGVALACGMLVGGTKAGPKPKRVRFDITSFAVDLATSLAVWVAVGTLFGTVTQLVIPSASAEELGRTIIGSLVGWLLAGPFTNTIGRRIETSVAIPTAASPLELMATDRRGTLASSVLFGAALGLACALATALMAAGSLPGGWSLVFLLGIPLVGGPAFGLLIGLLTSAWGRWALVTRPWLTATGQIPPALAPFLDDACRRGALRQAGAVYQFRHVRLQRHLAGAGTSRTTPAAGTPPTLSTDGDRMNGLSLP